MKMPKDFSIDNFKTLQFGGIGGIGLSRLAKYFHHYGKKISGSDMEKSEITAELSELGIKLYFVHNATNVPTDTDLLVYSEAIPNDNSERKEARDRKIEEMSQFDLLGKITQYHETIAIAGTNGKSTTTAMIGLILEKAGFDPTVFIGSKVGAWKGNLRIGKGNLFVIEADELNRQFLGLYPNAVVVTNIEMDHMDYYKDLNDVKSAFSEFIKKVSDQGKIIYNCDDSVSREVLEHIHHPNEISYGKDSEDVKLKKTQVIEKLQKFEVKFKGSKKTEEFELQVPGEFNVQNALAAITATRAYNVPMNVIFETLKEYLGIWRRFEILGKVGTTTVVSDYAHHPSSIAVTVKAPREFYRDIKIFLVFQPHQKKRTKLLLDDLVASLAQAEADHLIITEIFDVHGREQGEDGMKGIDFFEKVSKRIPNAEYQPNLKTAYEAVKNQIGSYDLVIVMGAGDIYNVANKMINNKYEI